ncbi:hypothetical protein ACHAW6_010061 [Cyclotella cf. meneghiniana]
MQSNLDPCLFVGEKVIMLVYVDDILMYARVDKEINKLINTLKQEYVLIRWEAQLKDFLDPKLLQWLLSSLFHPHRDGTLPKDKDVTTASETINYPCTIGMLLYLAGHMCPDIAFTVGQCARYTFKPTAKHDATLNQIGSYLKGTLDKGLILSPTKNTDVQDPHCAISRTGLVILVYRCPLFWKSSLQTEIALLMMEAEYLFHILDKVSALCIALNILYDDIAHMHIRVDKDNVCAVTLAGLES